jgi:hypothetical protein
MDLKNKVLQLCWIKTGYPYSFRPRPFQPFQAFMLVLIQGQLDGHPIQLLVQQRPLRPLKHLQDCHQCLEEVRAVLVPLKLLELLRNLC